MDLTPKLTDIEELELIEYSIRKLISLRHNKGFVIEDDKIICELCGNFSIIENFISLTFRTDIINCKHCFAKFLSKSVVQMLEIDEEGYLAHIKTYTTERDKKNISDTRRYIAGMARLHREEIFYKNKWNGKEITDHKKLLERGHERKKITRIRHETSALKNSIELPINTGFEFYQNKLMKNFDTVIETFNNTEKKYMNRYIDKDPLKIYPHFVEFKTILMEKIPKYPGITERINFVEERITKFEYDEMLHANYLYLYNNEEMINTLGESINVVSKIWSFYCSLLVNPKPEYYLQYFRDIILVDLGTIKKLLDC